MMRVYLTILIILFGWTHIYSQELKKIKKKKRDISVIERYTVLKSNKSIKHGEYLRMTYRGKILEKGYFRNNMKDSVWINYCSNGTDTASIGKYFDNNPIGRWIINDNSGKMKYIYDYSIADLIEYKWYDTTNRFPVLIDKKWIESKVDNPSLIIGLDNPIEFVSSYVRYPAGAAEKGVSGQIVVAFVIDSLGKMSDVRLKKGVDPDLDAEAIRVIKLLETVVWFPAKKDGKPITIEYFLPLNFILQ
jgi:periplasmic protein TonB